MHAIVEAHVREQQLAGKERLSLRITVIEDLKGLSLAQLSSATVSLYSELMRLDQDNYAETAKKLIIVNAPTIFTTIWSM